jgi:hypothetical protein
MKKSREFIKLVFRAISNFDITGDEGANYLIKHFKGKIEDWFIRGLIIGLIIGLTV